MELLKLCEALSPIDEFKSFSIEVTCSLREKFYPLNFTKEERNDLRGNWIITSTMYIVTTVSAFQHIDSLPQLCRMFIETKKVTSLFFDWWIVSFSVGPFIFYSNNRTGLFRDETHRLIMTSIYNKMENGFQSNSMIIYIEQETALGIDMEVIVDKFYCPGNHRVGQK